VGVPQMEIVRQPAQAFRRVRGKVTARSHRRCQPGNDLLRRFQLEVHDDVRQNTMSKRPGRQKVRIALGKVSFLDDTALRIDGSRTNSRPSAPKPATLDLTWRFAQ